MAKGEQPPEGLSAAALRAWKRRQKILARGEKGIDQITGVRNVVAEASAAEVVQRAEDEAEDDGENNSSEVKKETAASSGDKDTGKTESAGKKKKENKKEDSGEPKLAKWEQKWKDKAEKAPVVELEFDAPVDIPRTPEAGGDEDNKDSGLRQRKGGTAKDETIKSSSEDKSGEVTETSASMQALKERLRVQKWIATESMVRQGLVLVLSLISAMAFVRNGGLVCPSVIVGQDLDAADEKQAQFDDAPDDDNFGQGDGGFELNTDDLEEEAKIETALMLNMAHPPFGGWLSIPIAAILLRAAIHLFASLVGNYPFSMLSTVVAAKKKSGESSLPFPFSLASGMASMVPGLGGVMSMLGLVKSISEDVVLFLVVFIVGSASASLVMV